MMSEIKRVRPVCWLLMTPCLVNSWALRGWMSWTLYEVAIYTHLVHLVRKLWIEKKTVPVSVLLGKIGILDLDWPYLKHCNVYGKTVVVSSPSGERSGCALVHAGTLTLSECIPQTCSHVGQLFFLKARMLHLLTERQVKKKRKRDRNGVKDEGVLLIEIVF